MRDYHKRMIVPEPYTRVLEREGRPSHRSFVFDRGRNLNVRLKSCLENRKTYVVVPMYAGVTQ